VLYNALELNCGRDVPTVLSDFRPMEKYESN
jgi:hypothetical protein